MPPVRDLHRVRCAEAGRLGVGAGPVTADDPHPGMRPQPGRDRVRGAVGEQIQRPMRVDVDHDGAVYVPPP